MYDLNMSFRFIDRVEEELEQNTIKAVFISWDYKTNITDHNERIKLDYQVSKYNEYDTTLHIIDFQPIPFFLEG